MDDLSPEAILGIAAGIVAGVFGLGALVVRVTCPRVFAAHFGTRLPSTRTQSVKVPVKSDVVQLSQNPILVLVDKSHARALPREVDIASHLKVQRLKQQFKSVRV